MSGNLNASPTNMQRAIAAWGTELPRWVHLLASACDADNQRVVGDRIGKSSGYVSRLINNSYAGDMGEAERLVRAAYGQEDVVCPLWGLIPLQSCMRNRRRKGQPRNQAHRLFRNHCPTCPNNADRSADEED
jgi:hypothetical protein